MTREQPLWSKVYFSDVHREVCKLVGYVGFPVRELAQRSLELRQRFRPTELAQVLNEVVVCMGNRVMLEARVRDLCWQLLGPPPEGWDQFYRNPDGTPTPRPPGRETRPVIPEREIDPITDSLRILTWTDLIERLQKARGIRDGKGNISHLHENAVETIPCVESELVRRGMDIPPEQVATEEPKPKRKTRTKK